MTFIFTAAIFISIGIIIGGLVSSYVMKQRLRPLNDDQIAALWGEYANGKDFEKTVRAVERALGVK